MPSLNSGGEAASAAPRTEELPEALPMESEEILFTFDDEDMSCGAMEQRDRTSCPTSRSIAVCAGWQALIPAIINPFLQYTAAALGQPLVALGSQLSSCTSSFFEWDKLDRAVGGKDKPLGASSVTGSLALAEALLGTKLHQQTRKAIAKHQPALMAAIRKYNNYCEQLSQLHNPTWAIPLPAPLPTTLVDLRNDPTLMQDVWITPSTEEVPRWLEDVDVHDGIRALLKHERCLEEQRRLGMEADNMCRWFGNELTAIQVVLRQSERKFSHYQKPLLIDHFQMETII